MFVNFTQQKKYTSGNLMIYTQMENSIKFYAQNYSSRNLIHINKYKCLNISLYMEHTCCLLVMRGEMKTSLFSSNTAFVICMVVLHAMAILYSHKNIVSD